MKQCPNCGRELPDTATKCGYCNFPMLPDSVIRQMPPIDYKSLNSRRVRNNWIIMICMVIAGAPFFIIGLLDAHNSLSAIRNFSPTSGDVVGNTMRLDPRGTQSYVPIVEFRTGNGRVVRFTDMLFGTIPPTYKAGDKVRVVYDPKDPQTARIRSWSRLWLGSVMLMVAGLIPVVVGGAVVWATGRR